MLILQHLATFCHAPLLGSNLGDFLAAITLLALFNPKAQLLDWRPWTAKYLAALHGYWETPKNAKQTYPKGSDAKRKIIFLNFWFFWPAAYVLITEGFAIMQMAEEASEAGAELEFRGIPVIKSHDDLGVPLQANTPFQDKEQHTIAIPRVLLILSPSRCLALVQILSAFHPPIIHILLNILSSCRFGKK